MRLGRLIVALVVGGLALMAVGSALFSMPAHAGSMRDREAPPFQYTNHPSRVSTGRILDLHVDRDFDERERERIVSALRQWNYVLNGYIEMRARLLPDNPSQAEIQQIRRNGGWIVARVDSRHPIAHRGEGTNALAVTVGGGGGGYVYVISDRIGNRDLAGVVMHEFGHVLGAGHDNWGLMAPVYSAAGSRCIDYEAAAMVAQAQRLPARNLNWCEVPRYEPGGTRGAQPRSEPGGARGSQPRSASNGWH